MRIISPSCDFSFRQACAIESAARLNPNRDVFVLFAVKVGIAPNEPTSPTLNALRRYKNIHFRTLDLYSYANDTPAQEWLSMDKLFLSKYLVSHVSDYLRFLTLYKFGGLYFDLDVIIQTNFDNFPANFAGAEHQNATSVGALGFESEGMGHRIVEMIVRSVCLFKYLTTKL